MCSNLGHSWQDFSSTITKTGLYVFGVLQDQFWPETGYINADQKDSMTQIGLLLVWAELQEYVKKVQVGPENKSATLSSNIDFESGETLRFPIKFLVSISTLRLAIGIGKYM